jgi:hypothetical protein
MSQTSRSQYSNKQECLDRLRALMKQACVLPKETTEQQSLKVKRLEKKFKEETLKRKRIQSEKKSQRRKDS